MPDAGRGSVRRTRRHPFDRRAEVRRLINQNFQNSLRVKRISRGLLRLLLGVRRGRNPPALQSHRLLPFRRVPRALRRRECAPSLEAFHLALLRARGSVLPVRFRIRLDERGFLPRALPLVHPPRRLVSEVVLRARALVIVLDGGVGVGVGHREAGCRAGVRGPTRRRGSPPEGRAPRSLGDAAGRFWRTRAVIGPAVEASGGRASRRGLRARARGHAREVHRDAAHRRDERGHVRRSVGVDARDEVGDARVSSRSGESSRAHLRSRGFRSAFLTGDERLSQSAPRRRWRQARRRAPSMAASLDPATQAGIGAFAGLVEVTAQQVRRAACLRRNLPRAVSERPTNRRFPSPTRLRSPQIARREASGARTPRTRRRVIRIEAHDVLTRSTRPKGDDP